MTCDATVNRIASTTKCHCFERYFDSNGNCTGEFIIHRIACHFSCYKCVATSASDCSYCSQSDARVMDPATSKCNCIAGFYEAKESKCKGCLYSCETCIYADNCTSCPSTSKRSLTLTMGCSCPVRTWD
jgi:hypothetical protein